MDPLTIALSAAPGLLTSAMGAFRGSKDLKAAKAAEQEALGRRKYGVGSAWNQYLAASKKDKAADLQRQIAAEQEATSIDALKAGGAKALLGGLGKLSISRDLVLNFVAKSDKWLIVCCCLVLYMSTGCCVKISI